MKTLSDLIDFLDTLTEKKIPFHLDKIRDSILIEIALPNQMWEIEFMQDGTVEIEKFISDGRKFDEAEFFSLIREFAEPAEGSALEFNTPSADIWTILSALDRAEIFYTLERDKDGGLSVAAAVPGQRWRIAISADGPVVAEQFLSALEILDERELDSMLEVLS